MAISSNQIPNLANPFNIFELFTPIKHYRYFEQHSFYAFNANAVAHDKNNAWWLAELSSLIYHDEEFVCQQIIQAFDTNDKHITWLYGPNTDTQGVIIERNDCYIIVFRGTEFYTPGMLSLSRLRSVRKDLITDLKLPLRTDAVINQINAP